MPIYEYFCPNCQSRFELLRSMSCAKEDALCPTCNTPGQKVFSAFVSFSKDSEGFSTPIGSSDSCTSCTATSCSSCSLL